MIRKHEDNGQLEISGPILFVFLSPLRGTAPIHHCPPPFLLPLLRRCSSWSDCWESATLTAATFTFQTRARASRSARTRCGGPGSRTLVRLSSPYFAFILPLSLGGLHTNPTRVYTGQVAKAWVAAGTQVRTLTGVDEFDLGVFQTITYDLAHQVRGLNGGSRVSMLGSHGRNLARFKQRMNGS